MLKTSIMAALASALLTTPLTLAPARAAPFAKPAADSDSGIVRQVHRGWRGGYYGFYTVPFRGGYFVGSPIISYGGYRAYRGCGRGYWRRRHVACGGY